MAWGKVRCKCGKFMKYVGHSLATYVSGGCSEYVCRNCGGSAYIHTRVGVDDELSYAEWVKGDEVYDVIFDKEAWEFRLQSHH